MATGMVPAEALAPAPGFPPQKQTLSEAMERLLQPSLKEKGNALNVAQIAMLNMEKEIRKLMDSRTKTGQQIEEDKAEIAEIDRECADLDRRLESVRVHCAELRKERENVDEQLKVSKQIFTEAVHGIHRMINKTNSNVARLQRTQVPRSHQNFLKSGSRTTKPPTA